MYYSSKTYGTDRGLSCCFRQSKAIHSHCSLLHGYAIGVKFIFQTPTLDQNNWGFDFGGMKPIKQWLDQMFDHTVLVAQDDPALAKFRELDKLGLVALRVVDGVGCEMFARMIFDKTEWFLEEMRKGTFTRYPINNEVTIKSVEVFEHGSNSATYEAN